MFTDSGCLTTPLPLSLFYPPSPSRRLLPLTAPSVQHTHTQKHTCSCRLSVATLLLPLSNFSLSSHLFHTHAYIHMHTYTHACTRTCTHTHRLHVVRASVLFWQHPWCRHELTPQEGAFKTEEVSILVVIFWTQPYDWNFACRREMDLWSINTNRGAYAELHTTIPCVDDLWSPVGFFFFILRFPHMGFSSVSLVQALRVCLQRWWQVLSHHFRSPRW